MMKHPAIYKITNKINKKFYIGSAVNLSLRISCHKAGCQGRKLKNAIKKYGWDNFEFSILERPPKEDLIKREQYYLDLLKPYLQNVGYNICPIAASCLGCKHSEATKVKIRERNIGRIVSEETKKKMSLAKKDKYFGKDNPHFGKHHSLEAKSKISMFRKANPHLIKFAIDKTKKPIQQIDKITKFIVKTWPSMTEASKTLNINLSLISKVATQTINIKGNRYHTAGGYIWEFLKESDQAL